jgi:anti-sigma B factor antagonist
METVIGVFSSRERAAGAIRELLSCKVPRESIAFLTRSEAEAKLVGRDLGAMAGGVVGMGLVAGTALLAVPGIGEVIAIGAGAAAILFGAIAGSSVSRNLATNPATPLEVPAEPDSEDARFFREVLKEGRSLIVVRTDDQEAAAAACTILNRLGLGIQGSVPGRMHTATRQVGPVTILDVSGRITVGEGNVMLRHVLHELLEHGRNKILLNLQDVTYLDSAGLGELVRSYTTVRNQDGEFKLLNPSKRVSDLLQATKLSTIFDIQTDEASALQSFTPEKESRAGA